MSKPNNANRMFETLGMIFGRDERFNPRVAHWSRVDREVLERVADEIAGPEEDPIFSIDGFIFERELAKLLRKAAGYVRFLEVSSEQE